MKVERSEKEDKEGEDKEWDYGEVRARGKEGGQVKMSE
jgi:hypothetical protein